jgi:hypothetical protein
MRYFNLFPFLLVLGCYPADQFSVSEPPNPSAEEDSQSVLSGDDDDSALDDGDSVQDDDDSAPEVVLDAAVVLSATLPTSLDCGTTFSAFVEVGNIGTATWTRAEGYKLGAMNDEDPLLEQDTRVWLPEDASVGPNDTYVFSFDLVAPVTEGTYVTDWQMVHEGVTWFGESVSSEVTVTCSEQTFVDPLTSATSPFGFASKTVSGGSFSSQGWQTTGGQDQLLIELDSPIWGDGTLEIDVTNFDPASQYGSTKHQIINLYTGNDGSQAVFATNQAWWNIRTGTNYGTGVKFLASPLGGDNRHEERLIESASWNANDVHTWTVTWDADDISILLDGSVLTTFSFSGRVQPLQYIFLGKDNTYVGQVGPIYSNLRVTYQP